MKAYRLRIYPTEKQQPVLGFMMCMARLVYNAAIEERHRNFRQCLNIDVRGYTQRNRLCRIRNKHPDRLGQIPASTIDAIVRRVDSAWKGAFTRWRKKGVAEFPQVKNRVYQITYIYGKGCKYFPADGARNGKLRIMNIPGTIKVREHRQLPDLPIKQVSIRSDRDGKWFASLVYNEPSEITCKRHAPPVGIDLGLKTRVAVSDGRCDWLMKAPRWADKYKAEHRRIDRICSRRKPKPGQKGSKRYYKAKRQRAKLAAKIARCRADWLHNATTLIAESFEHIYCEDLQPQFMLKNKHMSRSAADAAFGEFKRMLTYKCGDRVTFVDAAYTTQTCNKCGNIEPKTLEERVHKCESCGFEIDRDINAARNVLAIGLAGRTKVT